MARIETIRISSLWNDVTSPEINEIITNIDASSTDIQLPTAASVFNAISSAGGLWEAGTGSESIQAINTLSPNDASGDYSFVSGLGNTASGYISLALGSIAAASGINSVAIGEQITASGDYSFACNYRATASGIYSHAEGSTCSATGTASHAEGEGNTAAADYSHVGGKGNIIQLGADYSAILGGTDNNIDATGTNSIVIGGSTNSVSGINAGILGGTGLTNPVDNTIMVPALVLASTTTPTSPDLGTIYFNGTNFLGWNGSAWVQLDN